MKYTTTNDFRTFDNGDNIRVFITTKNKRGDTIVTIVKGEKPRNKNQGEVLFSAEYNSFHAVPVEDIQDAFIAIFGEPVDAHVNEFAEFQANQKEAELTKSACNIYLDVDYSEKNNAKSHGAKWNPDYKFWFYPSAKGEYLPAELLQYDTKQTDIEEIERQDAYTKKYRC
ncbi:DUF5710 domain-containing protein [Marinomonas shanghaiensis]|uniref:DUF5710 domain-containing protein n=1 Tax=Marinomonas shanghaiensis TaxID=2202418 RepID=UPI000DB99C06|nr:DUF5710 domain-containing protein [Marinomonas shanghaiensis]